MGMIECDLTFDGVSSKDIGITVEGYPGAVIPEKDIETETVPGRNGDLVYDYGTFRNYSQLYTLHWRYVQRDARIVEWLHKAGYRRLEDSFHPEHYRMAYVASTQEVDNRMQVLKRMDVEFSCKPQWFRKDGVFPKTISASGQTMLNTGMTSKPLITLTGSGKATFTIGADTITISSIPSGGIVLDSELQDAYSVDKLTNLNNTITLSTNEFPKLERGVNKILFTGNVTSVKIVPRYWDLL